MTDDVFYFAYGSNMDPRRMAGRAGRAGRVGAGVRALLRGYRFAFDKRSSEGDTVYANIHPASEAVVWGVLYCCAPKALEALDGYEGVPGGHYFRTTVAVDLEAHRSQDAITYVACPRFVGEPGRPRSTYLERIIVGARAHQLPEDYVEHICTLARNAA